MLTVVLCYAQPLKNGICTPSEYFLKLPLSVMPLRIIPFIKRLRNLGQFNLLQNLHLCTQKSVCATSTRPFGEVGGNSPLQLSSRTHFAKVEDKKSYCEKLGLKTYQLELVVLSNSSPKAMGLFQIISKFAS